MASEEDLARIRAAAVQMALEGDVKGAAGLKAVHDAVSGKGEQPKAKGSAGKKQPPPARGKKK